MNTNMLLALALGAWALLRGKPAAAAPAPAAAPPPRPRPKQGVVTVPEVVIRATPAPAVPLSISQPVSAKQVPWPAVEQTLKQKQVETAILNRPATQSTKREAVPAFNIRREDGTAVPQDQMAAVIARERAPFDRSYWVASSKVTPAQVEQAKAYTTIWQKGGVWFDGPRTFAGRRQYRAAMHGTKKAIEIFQPKPPFV